MNSELVLPLVASIGWLILAMSALASHRLQWSQLVKMALGWVVIFGGIYVIVEWFLYVQGSASSLM
ncbi:hypothetical protein [Erythrobacter sp. CCH5-A1]|jgi:hypothetical protein|uniref:hypothetical protein n=1 Tax=Erythrobacter sp. CCH5-A1 TaxID=1768792 RepID=UPI0008321CFF|nr:hypothetical protein [Erythrobacter sp. CCH5-A1]